MSLIDDALDVQVELLRFMHTDGGERYAQAEADEALGDTGHGRVAAGPMLRHILRDGTTYTVSDDIVDFLDMARRNIPPYPLHASDLPSKTGFVWFEHPIVMHDDSPEHKPIVVAGLSWITATDKVDRHGLLLVTWTLPLDERDHAHNEFLADLAGSRHDVAVAAGLLPPRGLWSMTSGLWAFDHDHKPTETFRLLSTFLRFIGEPWVTDAYGQPSRPARRRATRERVDSLVRVIRLRRRPTGDAAPQNGSEPPLPKREWAHRWMVGLPDGRWRNQWYPSLGLHRPKWIAPYPKGPDGKPWLDKEIVFKVDR